MRRATEGGFSGMVKKVSRQLKKIIGGDTATQIEQGYRNDDLSLTCAGEKAVFEFLAEDKEIDAYLTKCAKEDAEEEDAEEKKSKK